MLAPGSVKMAFQCPPPLSEDTKTIKGSDVCVLDKNFDIFLKCYLEL